MRRCRRAAGPVTRRRRPRHTAPQAPLQSRLRGGPPLASGRAIGAQQRERQDPEPLRIDLGLAVDAHAVLSRLDAGERGVDHGDLLALGFAEERERVLLVLALRALLEFGVALRSAQRLQLLGGPFGGLEDGAAAAQQLVAEIAEVLRSHVALLW